MTKDMTTGNPVKLILLFSIPLLIGNIFQQFYSMADTIIVGKFLGVKALAAVGSTGSMIFLVIGFVFGLSSGFSVLVSQKFGANDDEGIRKAVGSAIILSIIVTIIITILSVMYTPNILKLIDTPEDIMQDAVKYITIMFAGTGAVFFYNLIAGVLRALGDSKTPLYFLIIASILNIVLDLVFIINLNLGVSGAAYATVISQGISGLLCLIYTYKKFPILKLNKKHFTIDMWYIKKHLSIAVPMALQFSITALGAIILQGAINGFGSTIVASYTASSKVEQLVIQPSVTFGVTMATYCAQNLGAGSIERIREGVKKCAFINIIIGLVAAILIFMFNEYLIAMFVSSSDTKVIEYAKDYLNLTVFFYIPLSLIFIYRNALQGMGYTFMPMMAGAAELLARTVVAFTLPNLIGYVGICLAGPIAWIAAIIPLFISYVKTINILSSSSDLT